MLRISIAAAPIAEHEQATRLPILIEAAMHGRGQAVDQARRASSRRHVDAGRWRQRQHDARSADNTV